MASDVGREPRGEPCVAVFGSSEATPGEPGYETARRLGTLLARAGLGVVTGGYGGVMEAASRGAREAGGFTIGVTCSIFDPRAPNGWLVEIVTAADLTERMRQLVARARGFVVLPGGAGTLAELTLLWALDRAGCLGPRPVVLLGAPWRPLVEFLERSAMLEAAQVERTQVVDTPERAVACFGPPLSRSTS